MRMKILLALVFLMFILHDSDGQSDGQLPEDYCIADEQTPEDQLFWITDWACKNGANCSAIQEYQSCFFPNTTKDHASYAFNSYYQNLKHNGAACYFNAAALLTGLDPSTGSCKFEYVA